MTRPFSPLRWLPIALCLVLQGAMLFVAGRWSQAPSLPWAGLFVILTGVCILLAVRMWHGEGRLRLYYLALVVFQVSMFLIVSAGLLHRVEDDRSWLEASRQQLETAVAQQESTLARVARSVTEPSSPATLPPVEQDPFRWLTDLSDIWLSQHPDLWGYQPALSLWRDGERIAWATETVPWPLPRALTEAEPPVDFLQQHQRRWWWRNFQVDQDSLQQEWILEVQVPLEAMTRQSSVVEAVPALLTAAEGSLVKVDVQPGPHRTRDRWQGGAGSGLSLRRDVPSGFVTSTDVHHLRMVASVPPRQVQFDSRNTRRFILLMLLWSASAVGWGGCWGAGLGLLCGLWLARALCVGVDFFRWVQPAFPQQSFPAWPSELTSLVDPAYFATPMAGGWFASTADAVLTALLCAATAVYLIQRWRRRTPPPAAPSQFWRRAGVSFVQGLAVAGLLLLLRSFASEVVENANPRLIGQKVPYRFLSFWALHLVLLLVAGGLVGVIAAWVARWRRQYAGWQDSLPALAGALLLAVSASGLDLAVRGILILAFLAVWWGTPLALARDLPLRRVYVAVPLLVTVLWNYASLAEAYGRAELAWLERKGEQIVQPQDDWIQFLLEDVLAEMVRTDAAGQAASDLTSRLTDLSGTVTTSLAISAGDPVDPVGTPARSELAADLWRNRTAYDLWADSAVRDLGLPCLIEIFDADGYTESLFAAGFLWDYGYEVRERSVWRTLTNSILADQVQVLVQSERRRYPTGEERILRGEVSRSREPGWIRLELPVQSKRISSLLAQLTGNQPTPGTSIYRPRAEVDRPLLLLRGDDTGWLDAGSLGYPAAESEPVISALQEGQRRWGRVKVEGTAYRCLWSPLLDAEAQQRGEGFLLGLQRPSLGERLLDLSRLMLVDLLLLGSLAVLWQIARLLRGERTVLRMGFQERFLLGYLALGLLLLIMAGTAVDRLSLERIDRESRQQTRNGLAAAFGQLQGLLAEQARALAESEYIADLLANRLAGQRPLGPFSARQCMVFTAAGQLLLDETLSDLSDAEAAWLLEEARQGALLTVEDGGDLYFATVIPIDLSAVMPADDFASEALTNLDDQDSGPLPEGSSGNTGPAMRQNNGFFFYRQLITDDLVAGLAEIIQGEVTLRVGGEAVLTSHPARIFAGRTAQLAPPDLIQWLKRHPSNPYLYANPGQRLSFTGCMALPTVSVAGHDPALWAWQVPTVLAVDFPARERDFAFQQEQTVLYLAGLASLILLAALLLALLMAWNIFGPVRILINATQRLAGGDFAAPLPAAGHDEVGTLAASFRTMRDRLRRAQDTLAERERFLTTVLDRVPVGVMVFEESGRVVALNPAGEQILAAFYGHEPSGDIARGHELLARLRDLAGAGDLAEEELRSTDGRRTLRARLAPLALPDGRRDSMIVFEDVTEFLANKRLALNAELARQVAHEIKNPLTPIQLSIQHLSQAYHDAAPDLDRIVEGTVGRILEQVRLLRSIATEFSLLGRPDELECAEVDLPALVRKVVAGYVAGADRSPDGAHSGGPVVVIEDREVPPVHAHAESLVKVLGNLLENSIDACGGPEKLRLHIRWRISDSEVTLVLEDEGPGLTPEVVDRLFDPYFSTKSMGTGLGLAICRNLLNKMEGRIDLANRIDATGAVAEVTLPRFFMDDDQGGGTDLVQADPED